MKNQLACILLLFAPVALIASQSPVIIDYFFQEGCAECTRIRTNVLPDLADLYQGQYVLNEYDTNSRSNVIRLIAYQQALGITSNAPVTMIADRTHVMTGYEAIRDNLLDYVDNGIAERSLPDWQPPPEITPPEGQENALAMANAQLDRFSLPIILIGGLLDGINPCAIGTLVFFMSLLAVSGVTGRPLIILGIAYCTATYITYFALGFGLMHALRLLDSFAIVSTVMNQGMAVMLVCLAALSLLDSYRYRCTKKANTVILQLPLTIKKLIHRIMRHALSRRNILLAGLVAGTLVTLLESACTGQLYLPVLLMLARSSHGDSAARAWGYLIVYNAAFLVPLVSAFLLVYAGTVNTGGLLAWSRKNVVPAKLLLAGFFLLLAVILLFA